MGGYRWGMGNGGTTNGGVNVQLIRALQADDARKQEWQIHQENIAERRRDLNLRERSQAEEERANLLSEKNKEDLRKIAEFRALTDRADKDRIAEEHFLIQDRELRRAESERRAIKELRKINPRTKNAVDRLTELQEVFPDAFDVIRGDAKTAFQNQFESSMKMAEKIKSVITSREALDGVPMVYAPDEGPLSKAQIEAGIRHGEPDWTEHRRLRSEKKLADERAEILMKSEAKAADARDELLKVYKMTPDQLLNPVSKRIGHHDVFEKDGKREFLFTPSAERKVVEINTGDPGNAHYMSVPEHDRFMSVFSQPSETQSAETPALRTSGPPAIAPSINAHQAAIDWARKNPNDPRSEGILRSGLRHLQPDGL